jgi:uncharacterized protein YcnI
MSAGSARWLRGGVRAAFVLAGCAAGVTALAGAASAHITVTPGSVPAGSAAELTFRVPDEEATAATIEVQLKIPTSPPIAQLLVKPVPGWRVSVRTITLPRPVSTDDGSFSTAVSEVTWSSGKILPGQFQDFSVAADPLPAGVSQLPFKAIQTYSNGDVVRWIDLQKPAQPAPDHPAPVLTLTTPDAVSGAPAASGGTGDAAIALTLGVAGLAAGLLGLAMGLVAWLRGRPVRRAGGRRGDQPEGRTADHTSAPANGQRVHP